MNKSIFLILLSPLFASPLLLTAVAPTLQAATSCCDAVSSPCGCCSDCSPQLQGMSPSVATPSTITPDVNNAPITSAPISNVPSSTPPLGFNAQSVALSGDTYAAADSKAGYIDTAIIRSMVRLRIDAAYDMNRPDRAEYFYTTWRAFGGKNPNANGPEPNIDRQSVSLYYEHAFNQNFSLSVDLPFVFSDPQLNPNDQGFGDMQVGLKLALLHDCDQLLTFQLKNYIPTADSGDIWVGTGHYSIEPGILYYRDLNNGLSLEAEIRDWISIGGAESDRGQYAGNVLRYGVGIGADIGSVGCFSVKPIVEVVGWSVLEGQVFEFDDRTQAFLGPADADGDTIVNLKIGTRIARCGGGSLYAGWGTALTGDQWYQDIFRLELRKMF